MKRLFIAFSLLITLLCISTETEAQTQRTRTYLHGRFETGDYPTQTDYRDVFATFFSRLEDSLSISVLYGVDTISNDVTLADSSTVALVTEAAVKGYVDAAAGSVTNGDKGDITVASGTWTIDNDVVDAAAIATGAVGTSEIANNSVANADLATMATNTIKGNDAVGTATPQDLTVAEVKTMLSIASTDVTDFEEAVEDLVGANIVAGSGVTVAYDDGTGNTTISSSSLADGDKGDIDVIGSTWTIDTSAVSWLTLAQAVKDSISAGGGGTDLSTLPAGSEITSAEKVALTDSTATWQQVINQVRDSITTGDISALLNSAIVNRQYDAIVRVDSTIRYALQGISDASMEKRYLVYVPDGTYNEDSLYIDPWIDVVGESRSGTIVQSTSVLGDDDVFWIDGGNVMLANMTVRHTRNSGDPGVTKYPIHCDRTADGTFTDPKNSTVIFYNLTVEALGTDAKSAFGIGVQSAQRIYIYNCTATSSRIPGIYAHNTVSATKPSLLYVINSTATGGNYGIQYDNIGSSSGADFIGLWGTEFSGPTYDIYITNTGAGAGETNYYIDPSCIYSTTSIVDTTKELSFPVFSIPQNTHPTYATYEGNTLENRSGYADFDDVGITTTGRVGIGTTNPAYPFHVYTTGRDISIFSQQYKTSGTTYAGYFQNALNTGSGDSYALYALNNSTKTGVDWGLWAQGERHYVSNDFGVGITTPARRFHSYFLGSINAVNYVGRFTSSASGAIAPGCGTGIELGTKNLSASEIVNARLKSIVTDTTSASFDADAAIDVNINGTLTTAGRFRGTVLDVPTGYRINNAATSGNYLRGNGTNFVSSAIQSNDINSLAWMLGGQNTGATASIGPTDAQTFNLSTGGSTRISLSGAGKLTSGTLTDIQLTASDSVTLNASGSGLSMNGSFTRLYDGSNIVMQVNNSNSAFSWNVADNNSNAFVASVTGGGDNFFKHDSTDGAEVTTIGSGASGSTVQAAAPFIAKSYTHTEAGALTPVNGMIIYVSSTDATFTSVGIWAYENGAWAKL